MLQSIFYLEIAIEIRQVHKRFIKLPIRLSFWHDVLYIFVQKLHNTANQNNSVKNSYYIFPCFFFSLLLFDKVFFFFSIYYLIPSKSPCPDPLPHSLSCMKTKGRFYICLDVISSPLILVSYIDPVPTPYILIYRYIQAFLPVFLHQKFNYPS